MTAEQFTMALAAWLYVNGTIAILLAGRRNGKIANEVLLVAFVWPLLIPLVVWARSEPARAPTEGAEGETNG